MPQPAIQRITKEVQFGAYRLTEHAEREQEADAISRQELEEAFGSESLEMLEDYPNDPRGASALFLGFTNVGSPLHAVIGVSDPDVVVLITVYRPATDLWYNWRRRI